MHTSSDSRRSSRSLWVLAASHASFYLPQRHLDALICLFVEPDWCTCPSFLLLYSPTSLLSSSSIYPWWLHYLFSRSRSTALLSIRPSSIRSPTKFAQCFYQYYFGLPSPRPGWVSKSVLQLLLVSGTHLCQVSQRFSALGLLVSPKSKWRQVLGTRTSDGTGNRRIVGQLDWTLTDISGICRQYVHSGYLSGEKKPRTSSNIHRWRGVQPSD